MDIKLTLDMDEMWDFYICTYEYVQNRQQALFEH